MSSLNLESGGVRRLTFIIFGALNLFFGLLGLVTFYVNAGLIRAMLANPPESDSFHRTLFLVFSGAIFILVVLLFVTAAFLFKGHQRVLLLCNILFLSEIVFYWVRFGSFLPSSIQTVVSYSSLYAFIPIGFQFLVGYPYIALLALNLVHHFSSTSPASSTSPSTQ